MRARRWLAVGLVAVGMAVPAVAAPESPLVSPAWLAGHLHDANLVILSADDQSAYRAAHIPGARHVALSDLSTTRDGLDLEMLVPADLHDRLASLGISDRSRVVVTYGSVTSATRILLTLQYAGLGTQASLLDGGTAGWQRAGQPVTADVPVTQVGTLAPLKIQPVIVDNAFVMAHLKTPHFAIVDARASAFYDGVQTGDMGKQRTGHIAGALSVPYTAVTDEQMQWKTPEELALLFTKAGVKPDDTIIGYCHIGQQATAMLLAARLTGHPILLYDGSFQDWSRHPDAPVENPAGRGRR